MKRFIQVLFSGLLIISVIGQAFSVVTAAEPAPPPEDLQQADVIQAVQAAIEMQQEMVLPYLLYETLLQPVRLSGDGQTATAEMTPLDPDTNAPVPLEPGLAIAQQSPGGWRIFLPGDAGWLEALEALPDELMPPADKSDWLMRAEAETPVMPDAPFTGYRLPWAGGTSRILTQSTAHDYYDASGKAHYAFDFAGPYPSGMFALHAAKSGVVHLARWTQKNGDPASPGNYLILRDDTTTPVSYQLYLHFAQDTIPEALRVPGTPVTRGQFIGIADDTGISSGNHLHFHIHLNALSYWGQSVDITFEEVDINGGRPRIQEDLPFCDWAGDICTATRTTYISQNYPPVDPNPPQGGITAPAAESTLASGTVLLQGWASDNTPPVYARFKAYYSGSWKIISPEYTTSSFSFSWDICTAGVADGPLSLALELRDAEGNYASGLPGLTHLLKNYSCAPPPPACQAGANQVALFSGLDFSGACVTLGTGSFGPSALAALGSASAASVQLGSGVMAALFSGDSYSGRGETLFASDPSLLDNRIGAGSTRSLKVGALSPPAVPRLVWPANAALFDPAYTSLSPSWEDAGGASLFRVRLDGIDLPWQSSTSLLPQAFAPGVHTWQVQARNALGDSAWSASRTFSAGAPTLDPQTISAPYSEDFEIRTVPWVNSSSWDLTNLQNHTTAGSVSWSYDTGSAVGYDTGAPSAGDLTSPRITIPSSGYYLRFWYRYETEGPGVHWDRRWVQISTNGSSFTNLLQLHDDPPNVWLQSPAIDLSAYAGQTVRIRFHFETLDAALNGYQGWFVDDVSINTTAPAACPATFEPDDAPAQARSITYGSAVSGLICPAGDRDYFRFSGQAGDVVAASAQAQVNGSPLDTYIFLMAPDGASPVEQNDDLVTGEQTDSALQHKLSQTGDYYLKLRAWNHPSAGGPTYAYTLNLFRDGDDPQAALTGLQSGGLLPSSAPIPIQVQATDAGSGIERVEFFWHSSDWLSGSWNLFGTDRDGADGWSAGLDPAGIPDQIGLAIAVIAYDRAGNAAPAAAWRLTLDRTPPVSALESLLPVSGSTVLGLVWSASDNLVGLDHFDLQIQVDGGLWQDALTGIPGDQRRAYYIGEPGKIYAFRIRAVDRSGNTEAYTSNGETLTLVPAPVCSALDAFEADDSALQAKSALALPAVQSRTFCSAGDVDDQDWVRLEAQAGKPVVIYAHPAVFEASIRLRLFASNGVTLLAESNPVGFGQAALVRWVPLSSGTIYLQANHPESGAVGSSLAYLLYLGIQPVYLPVIGR